MKLLQGITALGLSATFALTIPGAFAAEEISLPDVAVETNKSLEVTVDREIDVTKLSVDDATLLYDLDVAEATVDLQNPKRVMVKLNTALESDKSYRVMTISGSSASIKFETPKTIVEQDIMNEEDTWMTSVMIKDDMNLELNYGAAPDGEVEVKIFEDMSIKEMTSQTPNSIMFQVILDNVLATTSDYKFMLLGATDTNGEALEINKETFLVDFTTEANLEAYMPPVMEEVVEEEILTEEISTEWDSGVSEEPEELNAAAEVTTGTGEMEEPDTNNVEEIAATAEVVPETGATTMILIFMTLLGAGLIMTRK